MASFFNIGIGTCNSNNSIFNPNKTWLVTTRLDIYVHCNNIADCLAIQLHARVFDIIPNSYWNHMGSIRDNTKTCQ